MENSTAAVSTLPYRNMREAEYLLEQGIGLEIFTGWEEWQTDRSAAMAALRNMLSRYDKPWVSLHPPVFGVNLAADPDGEEFWRSFTLYKQYIRLAGTVGCRHMVVHPHFGATAPGQEAAVRSRINGVLHHLTGIARQAGVVAAVENIGFGEWVLYDARQFAAIFDAVPGTAALLDIGHAVLNGWDIPAVIRRLGKRLVALHISDNHGAFDDHLPIGMGTVDWTAVRRAWRTWAPQAVAVLEYDPTPWATAKKILADVHWLRSGETRGE